MDEHETLVNAWPLSMSVPVLQLAPWKVKARPMESTATQKLADGQDTPVSPEASVPESGGSVAIGNGAVNTDPFQVKTSPPLSAAMQKVGLAQDTALSCELVSTSIGWLHACPFHTDGPPSAAMQNCDDTQEIWLAAPQAPTLPDQRVPLKMNEFPSPSMAAQKAGPAQPMAVNPWAEGMPVGADHDVPLKVVAWLRSGTAAQKVALAQVR